MLALPVIFAQFTHPRSFARDDPPPRQPAPTATIVSAIAGSASLLAVVCWQAAAQGWHGWFSGVVLFGCLTVGADVYHQVTTEGTWMLRRQPDILDRIVGASTGGVAAAGLYWALCFGVPASAPSIAFSIAIFFVQSGARTVAVIAASGLFYGRSPVEFSTLLPPWWISVQNEFIRILVTLVAIWFPAFVGRIPAIIATRRP
jgi:hypothetical protein